MNQVWQLSDGILAWKGSHCADAAPGASAAKPEKHHGFFTLQTCASKPGQRIRKEDTDSQGTFLLRDRDAGTCLARLHGDALGLAACGDAQRWRELKGSLQVQHV